MKTKIIKREKKHLFPKIWKMTGIWVRNRGEKARKARIEWEK